MPCARQLPPSQHARARSREHPSPSPRRRRNEQLDREKEEAAQLVKQAGEAARAQEERLAQLPAGVDSLRISRELRRSEDAAAAVAAETSGADDGLPADDSSSAAAEEAEDPAEALLGELPSAAAVLERPARPSAEHAGGGAAAEVEALGAEIETMGAEASLRFERAKLAVTREEIERLRSQLADKSGALAAAEASVKELTQAVSRGVRSEKQVAAALEREKAAHADAKRRADSAERELSLSRKESEERGGREKVAGAEARSKDVRLNRALEELERHKTTIRQLREDRDGAGQGARTEATRLAAENTRLRKRTSELLLAFKKQAKLIDVLKRQKLHVEAATLLSFTEEEFTKTLELGETLA